MKFRIEVMSIGRGQWQATVEKNHGTEEIPEWWCELAVEGTLTNVLKQAERCVQREAVPA